jgi:hypothetical protein
MTHRVKSAGRAAFSGALDGAKNAAGTRPPGTGRINHYGTAAVKNAFKQGLNALKNPGARPQSTHQRRGLEDDEDLFERDLDVEGFFGREYDPLDERGTGDFFVRDFDTEELFGREYDFLDERDIIDSEDLFIRDGIDDVYGVYKLEYT